MAHVTLKNVSKRWADFTAVDQVSTDIKDGEFIAILGPSGCGKSTTLFMLAGIYAPTDGDILFDDVRINDVEPRDRNIGIVFQSYALYPNMSALENILFPLRFQKVPKPEAEQRALEVARLVEIEQLLHRKPGELSGGQQQRVALARALVKRPNLLLLDEPLSNLDATLRLTMRSEIRRLQQELGLTTVLVTHDQIEATTMADRVICMNGGRIEQIGTPDTLYHKPDTLFVAGFIGSPPMNMIEGQCDAHGFEINGHKLALNVEAASTAASGSVVFAVRPEALQPAAAGLASTIQTIEPMGRETLYTVKTPLGDVRFLLAETAPSFQRGQTLKLDCSADATLFYDRETGNRIDGLHIQEGSLDRLTSTSIERKSA